MYIQLFIIKEDWPEIGCLMEVSAMFHICIYCVFTLDQGTKLVLLWRMSMIRMWNSEIEINRVRKIVPIMERVILPKGLGKTKFGTINRQGEGAIA